MMRRQFLATSSLAAAAVVPGAAAAGSERQYLELREYHMLLGDKQKQLHAFLENAAIPALNRLGIEPVGVFRLQFGQNRPTLYVLLPHPSLESVVTLHDRLAEDDEFLEAGDGFLDAPLSDPSYVRMENSLMLAFSNMPKVEIPDAVKGKNSRIFEMRTYESHNVKAAKKKVEMFNEGGEIAIFRKTGLHPVFFGESIVGRRLPNLTYMLAFENMDQRNENWSNFVRHPDWRALSADPQYKDTVSNISDIILRPTGYSQI